MCKNIVILMHDSSFLIAALQRNRLKLIKMKIHLVFLFLLLRYSTHRGRLVRN